MKVGVFTPLLSSLPLEDVLQKLAKLNIHTVELGTGNYPGDPHCKLSMLENRAELAEFKKKLDTELARLAKKDFPKREIKLDAVIAAEKANPKPPAVTPTPTPESGDARNGGVGVGPGGLLGLVAMFALPLLLAAVTVVATRLVTRRRR